MWDRYRRDLRRAVRVSPGREKGLLVANYKAEREIYGSTSLTPSAVRECVKDIGQPDDVRQFHATLEAQERLSVYLSNVETRYRQLREPLVYLKDTFFVFKQYQFEENLLNDISWGRGKRAAALRQRIVSNSHRLLLGDITLDEEGEYVHVRVSDTGKDVAFKTIDAIRDQALHLKTKIEVARGFMDESAIHLKAYEEYLNGIEGELRELIRSAQCLLCDVESDSWHELREFLAQCDDDFLRLVEALPDYDALAINEDAYRTIERHHLFPKGFLKKQGITSTRETNQIANYAMVEWGDNADMSDQAPTTYTPELEARFNKVELERMYRMHALPLNWEHLDYRTFLEERRELIAKVIADGYATIVAGETGEGSAEFDLSKVVMSGESEEVEFKSTIRINLHTGTKDPRMELAVLKSLAGFLNTNGGTLIVGISDDGSPVGIQADEFDNEDKMNLHLVNIVKSRMGIPAMTNTHVHFKDHDDFRVMVVKCGKAPTPVFVKDGDTERFYVRTGPSTTELSPSQTQPYIQQRFPRSFVQQKFST